MQRWYGTDEIPGDLGPTVVTLGNFDGVHRGHRAVLRRVVSEAGDRGALAVAVTFDPHPVAVLYPDRAPTLISSLGQRLDQLATLGLHATLVLEFTHEFATETPEEFVRGTFVEALHASAVVVGKDTRFGVRNSGDVATLRGLGTRYGFDVLALDDIGEGARWSSTQLRSDLTTGNVNHAALILGRPHEVSGTVVHGDHRGRELGFPTANLSAEPEGMVPADGVYAGWLLRRDLPGGDPDRMLPAAISIGTNPTFDGLARRVEGYVLDRTDLELYGEAISFQFVEHLRPTLRFDSVEALVGQMTEDVSRCRQILSAIVPS
ncbi:MAG: bifunctional riboflavin kinase/FAD synthetase [Intrasporangium sp.]|uniref:bifunctional riboflavin kinase/FAD synthetase n=1 Tax=Intrasporangium sp. TaxID=1925024 RepID=UPI00264A3FD2|nr:bifunctional riboflavin kinase/FAD synthetase [Intrasporangium sp.]MDN5794210.1 bifunctional riboflavin kinase/FAD synthetase [Intrasporangium sp.]